LIYSGSFSIISESEKDLVIEFTSSDSMDFIYENNKIKAIKIGNSSLEKIDQFYLPFFTENIALPSLKMPHMTVIESNYQPIRQYPFSDKIINIIKGVGEVSLNEPGYFGNIPVTTLKIFGLKLIDNKINVLRRIIIKIDYESISENSQSNTSSVNKNEIEYYKRTFINSKYIDKWVKRRKLSISKPTIYPTGKWIKIPITEDGIYSITYDELHKVNAINSPISHDRIFLYSNSTGGGELSKDPTINIPENLVENAIVIHSSDNTFGPGDSLTFYGKGTYTISQHSQYYLIYKKNCYSDTNFYWLCIADNPGNPKRMQILKTSSIDTMIATGMFFIHHEKDFTNFMKSGKRWYGEKFAGSGTSHYFSVYLPSDDPSFTGWLRIRVAGGTRVEDISVRHNFSVYLNNNPASFDNFTCWNYNSSFINRKLSNNDIIEGINIFKIEYSSNIHQANAYLDFIEWLYFASLDITKNPKDFWIQKLDKNVKIVFNTNISNPSVYDITDWSNVKKVPIEKENRKYYFTFYSNKLNHFLVIDKSEIKKPVRLEYIPENQWNKLRNETVPGAEYVIITTEEFANPANELANIHSNLVQEENRLTTKVVYQSDIIHEFNADIPDPHAIRYFLQYAYNYWDPQPKFVLLLGDGTYDYRGIKSNEGNIIMTYQVESDNFLYSPQQTYSTDARFTYINGTDRYMDLSIGRITARTVEEAEYAVEKIKNYILNPSYGIWRSTITLVADDVARPNNYEPMHIYDSEDHIAKVLPKFLNINKIYLEEYPAIFDESAYGVKRPSATEDILKKLEDGTAIINYMGHGSPTVWAQEYILEMKRDLNRIHTGMKLPFWLAATCSWGYFDDIYENCMAEALVIQPDNGAIATLSATRGVYGSANANFVNKFYSKLFNDSCANKIRIGELTRQIINGNSENDEKYVLLGDPAIYLALPYKTAHFEKMDNDTLKILSKVSLKGYIKDNNPNGNGNIVVYDSDRMVQRTVYDMRKVAHIMSYMLPGEKLFQGIINFNTNFKTSFYIPKDISWQTTPGKITFFGWDSTNREEYAGSYFPVYYGGISDIVDSTGPRILLYLNNSNFIDGDIITPDSPLEIKIIDEHGINISGYMGHNITLSIDEDKDLTYIITKNFIYDQNSDTSGTITFFMPENLAPGTHTLTIKAWDNANNPSEVSAVFEFNPVTEFKLLKPYNVPNPFCEKTYFTFYNTRDCYVKIKIFTIRGLLIKTIDDGIIYPAGFNRIEWDGKDNFNDIISRGVYIYKIYAEDLEGKTFTYIGKMVKGY